MLGRTFTKVTLAICNTYYSEQLGLSAAASAAVKWKRGGHQFPGKSGLGNK